MDSEGRYRASCCLCGTHYIYCTYEFAKDILENGCPECQVWDKFLKRILKREGEDDEQKRLQT